MKIPHLVLLVSLCLSAAGAEPFALRQDDVVAFVGGTGMVRLQKEGRLEAALTSRFLTERPRFRDLAWDEIRILFRSFAGRAGGAALLAEELGGEQPIGRPQAERLRTAWIDTGLVDPNLARKLDQLAGIAATELEFSHDRIKALTLQGWKGDGAKGEMIFRSETTGCAGCHRVHDRGGMIGPDLSEIGNTATPERIVTELLWPTLQVKEGYSLASSQTSTRPS